jgi:hypothetical protein
MAAKFPLDVGGGCSGMPDFGTSPLYREFLKTSAWRGFPKTAFVSAQSIVLGQALEFSYISLHFPLRL